VRYKEKNDEEYAEEARAAMTEHDRLWANAPQRMQALQAGSILTKTWWKTVPDDIFMDELKRVLPNFYHYVLSLAARKQNREYILRVSKGVDKGDKPTNCLVEYVKAVKQIAKKKRANDLLPTNEAEALLNKSEVDILLTFVKVDESVHLADTIQENIDELDLTHALMAANGRTITSHERYILPENKKHQFKRYNISFVHGEEESTAAAAATGSNTEPFAWWEVQDDDDDNEEEEEVEEDAEDDEEEVVVDDRDDDMDDTL
jgi:hypothetical protein